MVVVAGHNVQWFEYSIANGTKLVAVTIGDKPLDRGAQYKVVTLNFLAGGGDNFWEPRKGYAALDLQDQVLTTYVQSQSPIDIKLEQRIRVVSGTASSSGGSGGTSAAIASRPSLGGMTVAAVVAGAISVFF